MLRIGDQKEKREERLEIVLLYRKYEYKAERMSCDF